MGLIQSVKERLKQYIAEVSLIPILALIAAFWRDFWIYIPTQISGSYDRLGTGRAIVILSSIIVVLATISAWHFYQVKISKKKYDINDYLEAGRKAKTQILKNRLLRLQALLNELDEKHPSITNIKELNNWVNRTEPVLRPMTFYNAEFRIAIMPLSGTGTVQSLEAFLQNLRNPVERAVESLKLKLGE